MRVLIDPEDKQRIEREAKKLGKDIPKFKKVFSSARLHCDYHFYFICIGEINKLLKRLCEVLDDNDLKTINESFNEKFGTAITIRDDLEHIDERALGKRKKEDIGHISDFGNFVGDSFTFHGKKFPVNKEMLKDYAIEFAAAGFVAIAQA